MRAVLKHIGTGTLLLSCALAQSDAGKATIENVSVAPVGSQVQVVITLNANVSPSVDMAAHPDRIVLDFPDTICSTSLQRVELDSGGLRRIRTAQHSSVPAIARVVIELDRARSYAVEKDGNRVVVTVGAPVRATRGAPAAATSGSLVGIFRRPHNPKLPSADENSEEPVLLAPPPATARASTPVPNEQSRADASTQPAASVPTTPPAIARSNATAANVSGNIAEPDAANAPKEAAASAPPAIALKPTSTVAAPVQPANANTATAAPEPETTVIARNDDPSLHTVFKVKYVAEGVAYLDGGRAQGLTEGMKLAVEENDVPVRQGDSVNQADPHIVAELQVSAVSETSAVTDIHSPKRPVKVGDLAYLSSADAEALVQQRALSSTRQYPAVISFTEGDTLDEEAREEVPKPPPPSVNRARGRIGFDYMNTIAHGTSNLSSSDVGMVFRGDITRIGGTYWNLSGYWRGRLTHTSATAQPTLQDLINRTYHLNLTYDNPNSAYVAGFGRLYLPWAPSLDTIDGGYFGFRLSKGATLGIFGGSTPDPSSWDYSPDRVIGGAFINFDGGSYDAFHYSSTAGAGVSMVKWALDRPFVFFEDVLSYSRTISIYESAQLDSPRGNGATPPPGPGLGRNFFTLRVNPHPRLELDANYNYFRDVPTFDPTLVGTGLLDKYLFQGFSAGARVEVLKQVFVSANFGRSSGTGDAKSSLNQMYGLTIGRLPLQMRADAHYARFNSSFGNGSYQALSLSRQVSDTLRLEALIGQQNFNSTLTAASRSRFLTTTVETTLGPHYYLQGNFTVNRGPFSYNQVMFSIGYRFDSKGRHRE